MNAYEPEWNYGPRSSTPGTTSCSRRTTNCPSDAGASGARSIGARGCHPRRLAAERHLPGAQRFPDHGHRRQRAVAAGQRGNERPNCVGDPVPATRTSRIGWISTPSRARRVAPGGTAASASPARPGIATSTRCWPNASTSAASATSSSALEAFNLTNTPSFGPPARDINAANTFGTITSTVSTARTVELVLKFFF